MNSVLILDFDGTIADSLLLTIELFNQVAPQYGLPTIMPSDIEQLKTLSARELINKYQISMWKFLRISNTVHSMFKKQISQVHPIIGLPEVILELKRRGSTLGIVSSNSQENVELFLQKNSLHVFDFIHSEKNIFGKGKVLQKLIKKHQFDTQLVFYIGDEVRDVEAARVANVRSVAVSWGFNSTSRLLLAQPDYLVTKPKELLNLSEAKINMEPSD